jgi:hypothetical protein
VRKAIVTMTVLALGLGACGGKKGAAECKAFVARTLECNPGFKTNTPEERATGESLMTDLCLEAMSGKDPGGQGSAHEFAVQMVEGIRHKVQTCTPKQTCEEFNACGKRSR